ncbi:MULTISPECIES: hypothetical protein [Bacillus]|uniref:Uncharacterized protein n=3 Tax=Bacillus subtilis TaxID=1423 RepID=S5DW75_BACIU|nr:MULTISPECIES: hypothetical protein [Bacillus]AGQ21324.1 unknown [Bacillus subtilis subsp. subtilis NCIB 3610 = ATCC 6051 = DSM 10]MBA4562855.1 hypothetical protein [Bacillus subtilis subsp. subtilis]MBF8228433.1 hypothetical protein [Bacillus subtilis]MCF7615623.1 hypothetical protein [Bacillus subtilis]MCM3386129.1 hypothetical protein [Bacillus subtilis]
MKIEIKEKDLLEIQDLIMRSYSFIKDGPVPELEKELYETVHKIDRIIRNEE